MISTAKRAGVIRVPIDKIENHYEDLVEMFFQLHIVVIRAEMMYWNNCIEYQCLSPHFDLCLPMQIPPVYDVISSFTTTQSGQTERTYKVEKMNA
jgi:hypothetical protein